MNRFTITLGWVFFLLSSCAGDEVFLIEGQVLHAENIQTVVLYEGERKLDSVFLDEQGRFKFRRTAPHPRLLTLEAGRNRYHFILQNGDRVSFRADLKAPIDAYEVSGSELSDKIKLFAATFAEKERSHQELEESFADQAVGLGDTALMALRQRFLQLYRQQMADYSKATVRFAEEHDDLAGFYAMTTLDTELAETELIAYADRIAGRWDDNARVRQFLEEMARL